MALPPISACLIVKNEEGQIESCLRSIRPHVSELVVVDTGSTDSTPDIVRKYADKFEVFTGCNDSEGRIESFAVARQRSFDLATQPWVFWADGDDEVVGADKLGVVVEELESRRRGGPAFAMFPYEYSHDAQGNVTCLHYRERLVSPKEAFKWTSPVHEVLTPQQPAVCLETDIVKIVHRRQTSGKVVESGRNLRILKAHYEKAGESDVRLLYYLGLEYGNVGDIGSSIKFHKRYVELSGWDDERFLACIKIAEHYQAIGDYGQAIEWAKTALTVRECWGEAFFSLGKSYYYLAKQGGPNKRRNWERSIGFFKIGLQMPPTKTVLFVNPMEREFDVHTYLNLALNEVGDVEGAIRSAESALKVRPDDPNLTNNLRIYKAHVAREKIRVLLSDLNGAMPEAHHSVIRDALDGRISGPGLLTVSDPAPVEPVSPPCSTVIEPVGYRPESFVKSLGPGPDGKMDIVFYVGPGPEPWTPTDVSLGGIGGSETMAMEMAKRLARLGHAVRLYGDCSGREGRYDGVDYIHSSAFNDVVCDILITSRRPHVVDDQFGVRALVTLCWVHDVHLGSALTHARALRIDRFLTLSNWHKQNLLSVHPFIHPDQVIVTRNGIDVSRFSSRPTRNPHRAVYSSSPDRGLWVAVYCWPRIRERIPDAELHVFYGFQTWEVSARSSNDQGQIDLIEGIKKAMRDQEGKGVFFHGRVDQRRLADEFLQSGVWAYPTWFSETSCQLAGSLISTRDGMKRIEDVAVGDQVLTHAGRYRRVTELIRKKYSGPLYTIKRRKDSRPIQLTAEHPLWVSRDGQFSWKKPGELLPKQDSLFTPRIPFGERTSIHLSEWVDMPVLDGMICRRHGHPAYKATPDNVHLDTEVMFLMGLFAADGHAGWNEKRRAPGAITFALHATQKSDLANRVIKFFGGKIRKTSPNGIVVTSYLAPWASFLRKAIGVGKSKRIPAFVWECSRDLQQAFLDGMFAGDGHTSTAPRGNGKCAGPFRFFTSTSPSLAYGFAQLLCNLGFHPGISYSKDRDAYTLNWIDRGNGWHESTDDGFLTQVESVMVEHHDGMVYNFEVEEDRSYVTDRTAVHNCITAMEAQAGGCRIVTSPIAALTETVGDRGVMIHGDWLSKDYQDKFVDEVVAAMEKPEDGDREALMRDACARFSLDSLADEWSDQLLKLIACVPGTVVPYVGPR
jgi:glycosyltransferase involved in cell wall biosynthesis